MPEAKPTFLNLPAEIRGHIFEFVLSSTEIVTFRLDSFQRQSYCEAVQPALTRVSRQVRSESLPIYYACNDFVLHTEGPKADDAHRWLQCNARHLPDMRRLSFWVRYVTLTHSHHPLSNGVSSHGALSISVYRRTRGCPWAVDNVWRWITVMRKPPELARHAQFIIDELRAMTPAISTDRASPADYAGVMTDIKLKYAEQTGF